MMGAAMCIMSLADERYMGMHIIMLSAALMLILYNWILFKNLRKKVKRSEIQEPQSDEGGFEQIK